MLLYGNCLLALLFSVPIMQKFYINPFNVRCYATFRCYCFGNNTGTRFTRVAKRCSVLQKLDFYKFVRYSRFIHCWLFFCCRVRTNPNNVAYNLLTHIFSQIRYLAVYRICFALVCFFSLMAVIMIGASSSKDPRSPIQNGFWAIKYMIVIGITIGALFIPAGSFGTAWMWVGLIGGLVFILVQLVLLVDFAHSWSDSWLGKDRLHFIIFNFQFSIR